MQGYRTRRGEALAAQLIKENGSGGVGSLVDDQR
jgi:hypothetical protein